MNTIKYGLVALFLGLGFFSGCFLNAYDLLHQVMEPSYTRETVIRLGEDVSRVGNKVIRGTTDITIEIDDGLEVDVEQKPSMLAKIARFLLILTITLAVTMILYNGMIYIIQTGQGKDSKDLTKNIIYIIVGIFVALFSVVIITLIQSVHSTLGSQDELPTNTYEHDQEDGISEEIL